MHLARPIVRAGLTLAATLAAFLINPNLFAQAATWTGNAGDSKFSTAGNWSPAGLNATGNTLTFNGTGGTLTNDLSSLTLATSGSAITFGTGAAAHTITGNSITLGSGGGAAQIIIFQNSAANQVISANLNLSGGNGDRSIVFGAGAGSLTLSGNINFNGDWLFPTTTAGTLILSGTNTGDGKTTAAITAGTNAMRAMMRNNVAGTNLVLGSDGALGNSGSGDAALGTAALRGIIANQQLNISTANGDRNLAGSTLAINANNITFTGTSNLTIGGIVNHLGHRDFVVSNTGTVTVGTGIYLSGDQTGRRLYNNLSGAGGMVVNGKIYDTLHSGGVTANTTTTTDSSSTVSVFRKAGTGTLTLNGDSAATFNGTMQIEAGTVKLGHSGALGSTVGSTHLAGGALDVNGQSIAENIKVTAASSSLINSSASAASISGTVTATSNALAIDTTGQLSLASLVSNQTITKTGAGTLALNGNNSSLTGALSINAGTLQTGHSGALGSNTASIASGASLDLNGQSISNTVSVTGSGVSSAGAIINSNTSVAAALNSEITNGASFTVGGAGDLTIQRSRSGGSVFTLTKIGSGTLTLGNGNTTTHMNLMAVDVQSASTVNFGVTSGAYLVADRGVRVTSGGTVNYTGTSTNFVGDNQEIIVSHGTFNMNGLNDTVGRVSIGDGTNAGTLNGGSSSTLTVGGSYQAFGAGGSTLSGGIEAMSGTVNVKLAGAAALTKTTSGTVTLNQANSYTGLTTIAAGTLGLGASEVIADSSNIVLNGGTLALNGYTETLGTLSLTDNSILDLGSGGTAIFGDSSAATWTTGMALSIVGTFTSGSSIRFGNSASGLSNTQLSQISISGFNSFGLDGSGFLTASAVPEPSTYALLAGVAALALVWNRRRKAAKD